MSRLQQIASDTISLLISWVPSTKRADNECIEEHTLSLLFRNTLYPCRSGTHYIPAIQEHTISLLFVVFSQGSTFVLFLLPGGLEGSISILERHGDVYDGDSLAGFIDCNEVWSERPIKARYRLVDSHSGGGRCLKMPSPVCLEWHCAASLSIQS